MAKQSHLNGNGTMRAALYLRVSTEEQADEGFSLSAQERAGRNHCDSHGWTVVAVYRDEGKSARSDDPAKRPDFARMLTDAEAGRFDVVVTHKLDRFARNRRVAFDAFHRLGTARVGFVSIAEHQDFSTPAGQLMLTMLVGLAQFYSDNLSFETKKGKAERKAQGLWNGVLPFGLKQAQGSHGEGGDPKTPPVPDPETYPGLLLAFRLAAEGKSDREVADALNAEGYRTTGNRGRNPFTKDTVNRMLKNRFYLGEIPDGDDGWLPAAHQAVLDPDLFGAARRAREANRTNPMKVNRRHRRYSLSGLVLCGRCGGSMNFQTSKSGRARVYCYRAGQAAKCGARSVFLDGIDDQIAAYLATFRLPEEMVTRIVAMHEQARDDRDGEDRKRKDTEGRLERMRRMYEWGDITEEAYLADRQRLRAELASLSTATDWTAVLTQAAVFLRDLPAAWQAATPEQRNTLARTIFQSVEIDDGRVVAVVPQPDFAPFFNLAEAETGGGGNDEGQPVGAAPCQGSTLAGGSDGGRISAFRTSLLVRFGCRSPTFALPRHPPRAGGPARGMTLPPPAATTSALAG